MLSQMVKLLDFRCKIVLNLIFIAYAQLTVGFARFSHQYYIYEGKFT
jgi:hypothetical protein